MSNHECTQSQYNKRDYKNADIIKYQNFFFSFNDPPTYSDLHSTVTDLTKRRNKVHILSVQLVLDRHNESNTN